MRIVQSHQAKVNALREELSAKEMRPFFGRNLTLFLATLYSLE
jgi:hypothetical protein